MVIEFFMIHVFYKKYSAFFQGACKTSRQLRLGPLSHVSIAVFQYYTQIKEVVRKKSFSKRLGSWDKYLRPFFEKRVFQSYVKMTQKRQKI